MLFNIIVQWIDEEKHDKHKQYWDNQPDSRGYRMLITKRCQKCSVLIDDGNFRYHADVRRNNMTSCQEDLLYESLPWLWHSHKNVLMLPWKYVSVHARLVIAATFWNPVGCSIISSGCCYCCCYGIAIITWCRDWEMYKTFRKEEKHFLHPQATLDLLC